LSLCCAQLLTTFRIAVDVDKVYSIPRK